ncbi:hypothetical protein [uncultured Fusobacterium sp.]|uniref:hypothetical protein n=1 Tax=uncultured Fusobacterium sp. TaxID=159267 RepID=UPI002804388D|nr:hypothetical protein [uncultured Fusobacterium sp.]
MHLKEEKCREKGFLILSVFFIVTIIMGVLFIGYQIVYSKGKKIISSLEGQKLRFEKENIETIIYNEFYKIEKGVVKGIYSESLDYFAGNKNIKRVWEEKNGVIVISDGGYQLRRILLDRKVVYVVGEGNFYSKLSTILKNEKTKNTFEIELEKKIENRELKLKIIIKVLLEYKFRNTNIETPDSEKIREVVVNKYV